MNFTPEQIAKAKKANSVEELLALAKENGMEMTDDEAKKYFADLHREGELADDELDNVSGGCGDTTPMYLGYPVRDSSWPPCEGRVTLIRCKHCNNFHYQNPGNNVGNCDGYCTKG